MTGLIAVCWTYLFWLLLGSIVNFNSKDSQSIKIRLIDNITTLCLMILLYFLHK